MIKLNCPKCGEELSVPDSLAGQSETCPECDNVCGIPQAANIVVIAKVYQRAAVLLGHIRSFCRQRRKLVVVVVANLVILTGIFGWLLPSWIPRPIVRFEAPATVNKGLFPARTEMAATLKTRGYYPVLVEPIIAVLHGRRLWKDVYVRDINYPTWAYIALWLQLDNKEMVVAAMTEFSSDAMAAAAGITRGPEFEAMAKTHVTVGARFLSEMAPIDLGSIFATARQRKADSDNTHVAWNVRNGYQIESRFMVFKANRQRSWLHARIIVMDKSWPRVQ